MEEIEFFVEGGGVKFYFFFQKTLLAHFSITFLSAIQVLVCYKKMSYFFAEYHRLETPVGRKKGTSISKLYSQLLLVII